jgi:hypothetical protein
LKTTLHRFAAKFPDNLLEGGSHPIDAWFRSFDVKLCNRNSILFKHYHEFTIE